MAAATLLTLWTTALPVAAQEEDEAASREGSSYGRIQLVEGRVFLIRAYDGERIPLELNLPLVAGDRLEAEEAGRLEAALADSSVLRAQGPLQIDLHSLAVPDSDTFTASRLQLNQGDLSVEVGSLEKRSEMACQVDTPAGAIFLMTDGLYRIRVDTEGRAIIWVREGVAEVEGDDSTVLVRAGQSTQLVKGRAPTDPSTRLSRLDEFERWVDARRAEAGNVAVDEEVVEVLPEPVQPYAEELARYGRWETLPTYGTVWVPGVSAGWTPYYSGYWVGSTIGHVWVSYEPWGWAPYHYGRWCWVAGAGWVWLPGARFAGAWVEWWAGPSYIAWVPLGYLDGPAIDLHLVFASHRRYPRAAYACIPYTQFYARDLQRRYVRDPRAFREHVGQAVPLRRLPAFRPRDLHTRPAFGSELYAEARRLRSGGAPGRRFHSADVRARSVSQIDRSPVRRAPAPSRAGQSHLVRTRTLDHEVRRNLPPATPTRPRSGGRENARGAGNAAGTNPGDAAARARSPQRGQRILDLLNGVPRRSPAPPPRRYAAPEPPRSVAAPAPRPQRHEAPRAEQRRGGSNRSQPRKPKHN